MQTTLHIETTVLPGNRVEFSALELREGAKVEVTVVLAEQLAQERVSLFDFLKTLPPGPRAFKTWDEYEEFLRKEKESWD
jgi:hypothetical protein